jgi:hypothetical protein
MAIAFDGVTQRILISGGKIHGEAGKSVEYTRDGGSAFYSMPDIPEEKMCLHVVTLDGGNIFIAGGQRTRHFSSRSCFLYESENNEWNKCPDMINGRPSLIGNCGVIKKDDGED